MDEETFKDWTDDPEKAYPEITKSLPASESFRHTKLAIQIGYTRKLIDSISELQSSIDNASESSEGLSKAGIGLTVIIAILTLVLVCLTTVLVIQGLTQYMIKVTRIMGPVFG